MRPPALSWTHGLLTIICLVFPFLPPFLLPFCAGGRRGREHLDLLHGDARLGYRQAEKRFKFIHLRNCFFGKEHMGRVQWVSLIPSNISARKLRAGGGAQRGGGVRLEGGPRRYFGCACRDWGNGWGPLVLGLGTRLTLRGLVGSD